MSWPIHSIAEIDKVKNILLSGKTNYWSGKECILFEKEFAKKFSLKFCCAISNASNGLEIALKAIGIKKNDKVLVPCKSYFSTASSVVNVGAVPIFLDIDFNTQGLNTSSFKNINLTGVKAIICVHLGGVPCDIINIKKFAKKNKLKLIEDCSQAHGARVNNKFVGSFGDVGVWSFCFDKIISTGGEGGMISTKSKKIWKRIWSLKEIGKDYDSVFKKKHKFGFKWVHDHFGSNYRMTEMQAGIGRIQLKNLFSNLKTRIRNLKLYHNEFKSFKYIILPQFSKNIKIAPYRFYMYLNKNFLKKVETYKILEQIFNRGIDCGVGSCSEIYLEKSFRRYGYFSKLKFKKIARILSKDAMAFKLDKSYTVKQIKNEAKIIKNTILKYKKNDS